MLSVFITGTFTDRTVELLENQSLFFPWNYMMMLLAFTILAAGAGAIIYAKIGKVAYDALLIMISEKTKFQYHQVRWMIDFLLLICGMIMGGKLTIGTVTAFLILGKMITFFWEMYEKTMILQS